MKLRRLASALAALTMTGAALLAGTGPTQAGDDHSANSTRSLAKFLAADGHRFDNNPRDFDVLDKAITLMLDDGVLNSRLPVLTEGGKRMTAFFPTDGAFRRLAVHFTGQVYASERRVFVAVFGPGVRDPLGAEELIVYHLVRGDTISYRQLRASAPTRLRSVQGGFLRVRAPEGRLRLLDRNADLPDARAVPALRNLNKGNRQIAHGISRVLSPRTR